MNVLSYLTKGKLEQFLPCLLILFFVVIRLSSISISIDYTGLYFDWILFKLLPVIMWLYLQKIHNLFSCEYVQMRLTYPKNKIYTMHILYDIGFSLLFIIAFYLIFLALTTSFYSFETILYFLSIIFYMCILYLMFLGIYHVCFLALKNLKIAYCVAFGWMIAFSYLEVFWTVNMVQQSEYQFMNVLPQYMVLLCIGVALNVGCMLYSRREGFAYAK